MAFSRAALSVTLLLFGDSPANQGLPLPLFANPLGPSDSGAGGIANARGAVAWFTLVALGGRAGGACNLVLTYIVLGCFTSAIVPL